MSQSTSRPQWRRLAAAAIALLVSAVEAATFTVPGSSPTIQGAITLAATGDTILVSPGTYPESINYLGKNLTVRSAGGRAVTTIAAPGMTSVVIFASGEGLGAVLDGFTITGGRPPSDFPYLGDGGGIFIRNSSPTISNNIVTGNVACNGGGIQVVFGAPLITGNTVSANRADCSQLGPPTLNWGGGISLQGGGGATVASNLITGNTAGSGSAIGMNGAGAPRIFGNTMTGNTATDSNCLSNGGTVWAVNKSDADIVQNVIAMNPALCNGGVVLFVLFSTRGPALVNNTIALNGGATSSGINAEGFDVTSRIVSNIVIGVSGSTAMSCTAVFATSPPIMRNNLIYASGGIAASGLCASQIGINGNQNAAPQFVAPAAGDYRLLPSSPAIDAGDGSDPLVPATDFGGAPRVQDGNGDGTAIVDIGAFEAAPRVAIATPVPASSPLSLGALAALMIAVARRSRQ